MPIAEPAGNPSDNSPNDGWLTNLVCPVSSVRVRQDIVRATALLVAALTIAYLVTRASWIPIVLVIDFVARGFGYRSVTLLGRIAQALVATSSRPAVMIDLAPKQFAARVGLLFSVGIALAQWTVPSIALGLAGVLTLFALLEGVGNICAGCLVYSYVMIPLVRKR